MLFAVVKPMHMSVPMSAGTLMGVWERNSIHSTPPRAKGTAISTISGSIQLWKFITRNRYTRITASAMPVNRPV